MKLKLISDFWDVYDPYFDCEGEPFYRLTRSGLARPAMLEELDRLGYITPRHGRVFDFGQEGYRVAAHPVWVKDRYELGPNSLVVVYLDEHTHRGEGKALLKLREALALHPGRYATVWCHDSSHVGPPTSVRHLWVGSRGFWMKYRSDDLWRSNVGEAEIENVHEMKASDRPAFSCPLFAVDLVFDGQRPRAIDLNIAPGIRGTGVEAFMTGKEIVEELKFWVEVNRV